jgi:hypothetical protein
MAGGGDAGVEEAFCLISWREVALDATQEAGDGCENTWALTIADRSIFLLSPLMKIRFALTHALWVLTVLFSLQLGTDCRDQAGLVGSRGQLRLKIQSDVPNEDEMFLVEFTENLGST